MKLTGETVELILCRKDDHYTRVVFVTASGRVEIAGGGPKKSPLLTLLWRSFFPTVIRGRRIERFLSGADGEWVCELDGGIFLEWRFEVVQHSPNIITGRDLFLLHGSDLDESSLLEPLGQKQVVAW